MPSWNNLTAPGYDQIGTSIDDLNVDASAFDNSSIIPGKDTHQFSDFSGSFDTHFSTTEFTKTYATHGRFDLGLGLADPRLQSVTQHLGFDPSHTERAGELQYAVVVVRIPGRHADISLSTAFSCTQPTSPLPLTNTLLYPSGLHSPSYHQQTGLASGNSSRQRWQQKQVDR